VEQVGSAVTDLSLLALALMFFAAALAYMAGCQRLK
jgi:hypothetical protein